MKYLLYWFITLFLCQTFRRLLSCLADIHDGGGLPLLCSPTVITGDVESSISALQDVATSTINFSDTDEGESDVETLVRRWTAVSSSAATTNATLPDKTNTILSDVKYNVTSVENKFSDFRTETKPLITGHVTSEQRLLVSPIATSSIKNKQLLALKHAELRGWFLGARLEDLRTENVYEWAAWYVF